MRVEYYRFLTQNVDVRDVSYVHRKPHENRFASKGEGGDE